MHSAPYTPSRAQHWAALSALFGQPLGLPNGAVVLEEAALPQIPPAGGWVALPHAELGGACLLGLESLPLEALSGTALELADLQVLPPELRDDLLLLALESLRPALPPALAAGLGEARIAPAPEGWEGPMLRAALEHQGMRAGFLLALGPEMLGAALALLGAPGQAPRLPEAIAAQIPVPLRITAGRIALSLAQLQALRPGDALLIGAISTRHLRSDQRCVIALTEADDGWRVEDIAMTDTSPEEGPIQSLEALPVTLAITLGERVLPLSELRQLGPGALIPFEMPEPAPGLPVGLSANGRAIGSGHLITVDGAYAVRITSLFEAADLPASAPQPAPEPAEDAPDEEAGRD